MNQNSMDNLCVARLTEMGTGRPLGRRIGISLRMSFSLLAVFSWDAAAAPADRQMSLAHFDATVLPLQEREAAPRMIEEDVQRRLREFKDRKSTRLNSSHIEPSRMPSSA